MQRRALEFIRPVMPNNGNLAAEDHTHLGELGWDGQPAFLLILIPVANHCALLVLSPCICCTDTLTAGKLASSHTCPVTAS